MAEHSPRLTELDASHCRHLGGEAGLAALARCTRLERLRLNGCKKLSDDLLRREPLPAEHGVVGRRQPARQGDRPFVVLGRRDAVKSREGRLVDAAGEVGELDPVGGCIDLRTRRGRVFA